MQEKYKIITDKLVSNINQVLSSSSFSNEDRMNLSFILTTKIIKEDLKPLFNTFTLYLGGHNNSYLDGKTMNDLLDHNPRNYFVSNFYQELDMRLSPFVCKIIELFNNNLQIDELKEMIYAKFIKFLEIQKIDSFHACSVCGKKSILFINDDKISVIPSSEYKKIKPNDLDEFFECKFKDGIPNFSLKTQIKSKKMVFANNLTSLFDNNQSDDYIIYRSGFYNDINSEYGAQLHQEYWHKRGLMYIATGNTSPAIYKDTITGELAVIEKYVMDNSEALENPPDYPINVKNMKYIDYISTALWAVCAVESSVIEDYAKKNNLSYDDCLLKFSAFEVDVEPGNYLLTTYSAHRYANRPVFLSMQKI
jgi:hypothetical protein